MITGLPLRPRGGFRPIGLFRGLYRVWARARKGLVDDWARELTRDRPMFTMTSGRKATDAVCRSQVRTVAAQHRCTVELDWDVAKCFEHVVRSKLRRKATDVGYPAAILRLSLALYAWKRYIRFTGGIVEEPALATRGVVAGLTFVVYEFLAYMFTEAKGLQDVLGSHGQVNIHVDDVAVVVQVDTPNQAATRLEQAGSILIEGFEHNLELPFDKDKAFVVGKDRVATRLP